MPEAPSVAAYLHRALSVGTTTPFDVASALLLVSELEGIVDLRLPSFLDAAPRAELDGLDEADPYREAVARAMLCHLIADLRRHLADEAPPS